ncbi:hypothetical protein X741_30765 [Mesorhizobium sp. LNHC229A00]|nr:hypothetical protein X741_30765 [Mesorhizobium sp. LNHC229A00]
MPLPPEVASKLTEGKAVASNRPQRDGILRELFKRLNEPD